MRLDNAASEIGAMASIGREFDTFARVFHLGPTLVAVVDLPVHLSFHLGVH